MQIAGLVLATLMITGGLQREVGQMEFPDGVVQHVVTAKDTPWRPCPPNLPSGCEIAVLEGNPQGSGLFTVRFRVSGEFFMPHHTHPQDERVTVLEGKMLVAFGTSAAREDAKQFGPGDYYVNKREEVHAVWAEGTSVIQITGMAPWIADFVDDNGP